MCAANRTQLTVLISKVQKTVTKNDAQKAEGGGVTHLQSQHLGGEGKLARSLRHLKLRNETLQF